MIEFRCPACGKLLRTTDANAGCLAPCSGCGQPVTVPESSRTETAGAQGSAPPQPDEGEFRPCPMCGEQIRSQATLCRFCGESLTGGGEFEELPAAHRGSLLLALSVCGLLTCAGGPCGLIGLIPNLIVLILARQDLRAMSEGRMDPGGRGLTQAARIIAIIQIVLVGALMLFYLGLIVYMLLTQSMPGP